MLITSSSSIMWDTAWTCHTHKACLYNTEIGREGDAYSETQGVGSVLGQCWVIVFDAVPALAQHRPNALCLLARVITSDGMSAAYNALFAASIS